MARNRGARKGSTRFYRGRTTHTSSERKKLNSQKEYRRSKLSKQKRAEMVGRVIGKLRWVVVLFILFGVYSLAQIKSFSYVGFTGLNEADISAISSVTEEYVRGFNRFKPFLDGDELEAYILDQASFIRNVEVSTSPLSTVLRVRVFPKTPLYRYSGTPDNSQQWIADDGSLISLTQEQIEKMGSSTPVISIKDSSRVEYDEGELVLPVTTLEFMQAISIELGLKDYTVSGYRIGDTPRELAISLAGEKYELLVSVDRPVESILTDFAAANAQIRITKAQVNEYIDLSVEDKVFYR